MRPDGISTFCGADRGLDLLHGDVVGRHAGAIEPDAHGVAALAADLHLGDAGDVLDPVGDEAVGEIGQLERVVPRAGQRQIDDRLRVGLDLGDDRLVDLARHAAAHAADAVAHVGGRDVGIDVGPEAHGDVAALLAAGRGDDLDALDAGDRVLQDLRDLRLDDLGAGARYSRCAPRRSARRYWDIRAPSGAYRRRADQHDEQAEHRREDGPADEELEQAHAHARRVPQRARLDGGFSLIATVAPSRSRIWPAVTICIVGRQPLDDLDLARQALADLDGHALRLAVLDDVDDLADAVGHHGRLGHDDRILALVDDDDDAGEQARLQHQIGIGNGGAQPDGAAVDVDHRIDREDRALRNPRPGDGIDLER